MTDNSQYASWAPTYDPKAIKKADGQCSTYDTEYCSWSNLPDDDWVWQDDKDWVIGEFVWTGYDYLGEPTPYDEYWPSRSSYFGICDLAGLPKDRYYLYRSLWNKDSSHHPPVATLELGHSSKKDKGHRIGQVTPVYCHTDYPSGRTVHQRQESGACAQESEGAPRPLPSALERCQIRAGRSEGGGVRRSWPTPLVKQTIRTAGKPAALKLDVWTAGTHN